MFEPLAFVSQGFQLNNGTRSFPKINQFLKACLFRSEARVVADFLRRRTNLIPYLIPSFSSFVVLLTTMHPDVAYEAFLFSSRHTLDTVQLVSRALRDAVGQSTTLPLRYIRYAWLVGSGLFSPYDHLVVALSLNPPIELYACSPVKPFRNFPQRSTSTKVPFQTPTRNVASRT